MRAVYRRRRDVTLSAIGRHLPSLDPSGISAGLHFLAWLPDGTDEQGLVAAAAEEGIGLIGASTVHDSATDRRGLILGYGSINERQIEDGIARLADVAVQIGEHRLVLGSTSVSTSKN